MNQTSQKSKGLPAWGDTKVINTIQQHYIVYSYYLHKKNLDSTKKMIDNSEPLAFKEKSQHNLSKQNPKLQPINTPKNKPQREKNLEQDIENGSLVSRMLQITEKGSLYNKDYLQKHLFKPDKNKYATHRKVEAEKVSKENHLIYNRLEKVQSTINFDSYQKQYSKFKKYRDNITRSSRRIFNCFIKTDQNQELLATSSTAYGRFSNLSQTQSIQTPQQKQPYPSGQDKLTSNSKKRPRKIKQIKTEGEEINFHKFPEDDSKNIKNNSHQNQKESKQVEMIADQQQQQEKKNSKQDIKSQRSSQSTIKENVVQKKNSIEENKKNNSNELKKNKSIPSQENIPENRQKQSSTQSNTEQAQNQDDNHIKTKDQTNEKEQENPSNTQTEQENETKFEKQQSNDQQQSNGKQQQQSDGQQQLSNNQQQQQQQSHDQQQQYNDKQQQQQQQPNDKQKEQLNNDQKHDKSQSQKNDQNENEEQQHQNRSDQEKQKHQN